MKLKTVGILIFVVLALSVQAGCEPQEVIPPWLAVEVSGADSPEAALAIAILGYLAQVFASFGLKSILLLIFLDLGFGVARAWRTDTFDWAKTANFYKTSVIPYLFGYMVWYIAVHASVDTMNLGQVGTYIGEGLTTVAWGTFVSTVSDSILGSLKVLYGTTFKAT